MHTLYQSIFVDIWPWYVGGPAIGLYVLVFLLAKNRLLSASATFQFVTEKVIGRALGRKESIDEWLMGSDPGDREQAWLGWYFVGLFLGGGVTMALAGTLAPDWTLPGLDRTFFLVPWAHQAALLGFAGMLIGFGTRMSGGCTSGHCIVGVSGLQAPSLAATGTFFATGIAASFAAEALVRGGWL